MNLNEFKDPGKEYRAAPFWSWNDDLKNDELRWQVKEMKDRGFGGYFMHSRVGLKTPYLSDDWMDRIAATLDEGKKQDMQSWLYDEDKWPSGAAGGLVTAEKEEYRAKYLQLEEIKPDRLDEYLSDRKVLAIFAVNFTAEDGQEVVAGYKRIEQSRKIDETVKNSAKYFVFKMMTQKPSNWFNGQAYADLLNPEAVTRFIEITYKKYREQFGDDFGEYMPGVFTDEPNYINQGQGTRPWTDGFEKYFEELNGYDLLEDLPLLFFETAEYQKVRFDFFKAITKRFIECFSQPLYQFCQENNLEFTGHYLAEDTMYHQTGVIGAAMPHYKYMQLPGIDHLGRNINAPLTLKQCSSVAHQFGRNRVLCENFGVSGHSMSFEDQKWIADFHFALGITYTCQHLVLYSMVGDRKRDYPPTFSYHQPYWKDYKLINDYMARAGWVCSQGDFLADTLVLHPVASVWANYSRGYADNKYDHELVKLQDSLLSAQIGFDFGDELIMEDEAEVITQNGEAFLQVGSHGKYRVIVIPPSLTWSDKTFALLDEFAAKGGKIVFCGEKPELVNGRKAEDSWQKIEKQDSVFYVDNNFAEVSKMLNSCLNSEVKVKDKSGNYVPDIYLHSRKVDDNYLVFLSNKNRTESYQVKIELPYKGSVSEMDLKTGEIFKVAAREDGKNLIIDTEFAPVGSHVFLIDTTVDVEAGFNGKTVKNQLAEKIINFRLPSTWDFQRLDKNSLTLDFCFYRVNGSQWSQQVPVWKVRKKMWHQAGLGEYDGVQPWVIEEKGIEVDEKMTLEMAFDFQSEVSDREVGLVIEKAADWQLQINGIPVDTETDSYYWDKQFSLLDISNLVQTGNNTVLLKTDYRYGIEVEDIYLVGDFAVKQVGYKDYLLTEEENKISDGSWVYQGYPFYAGNLVYRNNFQIEKTDDLQYILCLNNPEGSLFKIRVNDGDELVLISQPWQVDISQYCVNGQNKLEIQVVSSLRNTFGPLHHRLQRQPWTGPGEFVDENNWVDAYQFEDYGLIDGASIIIRR